MKSKVIKSLKIFVALMLVMIVSITSFAAYRASSILKKAWSTDPLLEVRWSNYSKDFQIVARSEFERQNIMASFSRITLQRYLNEERINQLEWHALGFITYLYSNLFVSEEEALSKFINYSYMGANINGFSNASRYYFDKPLNELDLAELALLFAISAAPARFNPFKNIEYAKKGRAIVLEHLRENGVSSDSINLALEKPISLASRGTRY
jgi:hypothetical protein